VIEATGVPGVVRQAIDVVASSGTVVVIGLSDKSVELPMIEFTRKEISVLGSRNSVGIFGDAVDLVRRNADTVRQLVTHRFPFAHVGEAIEFALANMAQTEKVMVHMKEVV
jgi:threonine dehydrogenase-like Zn-dependent dehydrogenase